MLRTFFFLTANGALQLSVSNSQFSFEKKSREYLNKPHLFKSQVQRHGKV